MVAHSTDTHGFTEQLFGLCFLLGYSFMPRFKDLKKRCSAPTVIYSPDTQEALNIVP